MLTMLFPFRLGLDSLLLRTSPDLAHSLAEPLAPMLAALVKAGNYTHLATAHSALGKNIFPRVAGILDVQQVRHFFFPFPLPSPFAFAILTPKGGADL